MYQFQRVPRSHGLDHLNYGTRALEAYHPEISNAAPLLQGVQWLRFYLAVENEHRIIAQNHPIKTQDVK